MPSIEQGANNAQRHLRLVRESLFQNARFLVPLPDPEEVTGASRSRYVHPDTIKYAVVDLFRFGKNEALGIVSQCGPRLVSTFQGKIPELFPKEYFYNDGLGNTTRTQRNFPSERGQFSVEDITREIGGSLGELYSEQIFPSD